MNKYIIIRKSIKLLIFTLSILSTLIHPFKVKLSMKIKALLSRDENVRFINPRVPKTTFKWGLNDE